MATGKGAYLMVDSVNLSAHARSVENNFTQDEVEATTLADQYRVFEPTYARNVLNVRMKWSPTVQTFMDEHQPGGADYLDLTYEYGPDGNATGKPKFSGTANVIAAQQIPPANPGNITEVLLTLNLNSATVGTFA